MSSNLNAFFENLYSLDDQFSEVNWDYLIHKETLSVYQKLIKLGSLCYSICDTFYSQSVELKNYFM